EPGALQEGVRIDAAGVRRVEQHRSARLIRLDDLKRWIELVLRLVHGARVLGTNNGGLSGGSSRGSVSTRIVYAGAGAAKRPFHRLFTSIPANGRRGWHCVKNEQIRGKAVALGGPRRAS